MPKGVYNRKVTDPPVFVAKESFTTIQDGTPISVPRGVTVHEGHPLLLGREHLFELQVVNYPFQLEVDDPEPEPVPEPKPKTPEPKTPEPKASAPTTEPTAPKSK